MSCVLLEDPLRSGQVFVGSDNLTSTDENGKTGDASARLADVSGWGCDRSAGLSDGLHRLVSGEVPARGGTTADTPERLHA